MRSADTKEKMNSDENPKILQKSSTTTELEVEKKEYKKKYYMGKIKENIKDENISDNEERPKGSEGIVIDTYKSKYESYNPGLARRQKYSYNSTFEKSEEIKDNDVKKPEENKFSYRFGKKYSKTEENNTDSNGNESGDKFSYRNKYLHKSSNKSDKEDNENEGKYKTKFGNKINLEGDVKIEVKETKIEDKPEISQYTSKYKGRFKGNIETSEDNSNKDNNIRTSAWKRFKSSGNSVDDKSSKSNTESKFRFGYKSKYFSKENKTEDIKDEKNGNIVESNEDKSNRDNESYSQDSRKVSISKKYKSKRFSK